MIFPCSAEIETVLIEPLPMPPSSKSLLQLRKPRVVQRVLDCTNGIGTDYGSFLESKGRAFERIDPSVSPADSIPVSDSAEIPEIVLFLKEEVSSHTLRAFRWIVAAARCGPIRCIVVIESVSLHLGDPNAAAILTVLRDNLRPHISGLTIIRTGFILNPLSRTSVWLRRLSGLYCLLPSRMTSTFIEAARLFAIILEELDRNPEYEGAPQHSGDGSFRDITILGRRRPWRDVALQFQSNRGWPTVLRFSGAVMSLLGIPWLVFWAVVLTGKFVPSLRQFHFHTLKPRSVQELVSLYNRHNCRDVQIAGYNNGVNHFGWKYPEKTVVLTTSIPGEVRLSTDLSAAPESRGNPDTTSWADELQPALLIVDSGLTLNYCIRELNRRQREFYVVPNYSWISMGTLFFVPVHGSGSRVSTLGDTIEHVVLYDGDRERTVEAHRGDELFRDAMYNRDRCWLLLKLSLRVKPKSKYFVRRSKMENPSADEIWKLFDDPEASNVEVRKNKAASTAIDICHYYLDSSSVGTDLLEMPRDRIGRIWDRLEETPIVSTLFHWFVRTFAFHVELFLKPSEFAVFWDHHHSLPVSKIQLRRVLKDGMTHSACEHYDCISADLFMTRRNRDVFRRFIATHLPDVRTNPGKQSV